MLVTSDRLELIGLRVDAICGVLPHERTTPQPLEIDVEIVADLSAAGASDDLADTIDYGAVVIAVEQVAITLQPQLLEHLAERIAAAVLLVDDRATGVTIAVRKLAPPVPQRLASSGVRITRSR
ncbi:MAG: 7,8-dihydroneopterin aldolase/epimerase/oxygenase [Actinomycetota bacterium]|nr:7,8-dihydroneopterin aldolase/epimerase/oxygenase [Actinomycetota bacterium]